MLQNEFSKVFRTSELSVDNDTDTVSNWLLSHSLQEPDQRIRHSLKQIYNTNQQATLLLNYVEKMKAQILQLQVRDVMSLRKVKTYFEFPLHYLSLGENDQLHFQRSLNSLLRYKITDRMLEDQELLNSIGLSCNEISKFNYEELVKERIAGMGGIWDRSIIDAVDANDITRFELAKLRIREIFDIVMCYPKSIHALEDLRQCIEPQQRPQLVNSFVQKCTKALLHAGANTNDIILCYTSTIRSFLIVDPRGVLLDHASRSIRRYLKEREDTIPTIVASLLRTSNDPQLSSLADELTKAEDRPVNDLSLSWSPDPIDALPDFRKQDLIESLISIFDSKELLINEFIQVFSKKLLSLKSYDISEVETKLEQLKSKLGDAEFENLDVMIRDISESKVFDKVAHLTNEQLSEKLQFSILSYYYWPELPEDKFVLPSEIEEQIELYKNGFEKVKKGRKLSWINSGVITVELELGDRVRTFEVTPDKASVIYLFHDIETLSKADIISKIHMNPELLENCLNFWIKNGILKDLNDETFTVQEVLDTPFSSSE